MNRITASVVQVGLKNGKQRIVIMLGGDRFELVSEESDVTRGLGVALFTAKCVTLEIEPSADFPVPGAYK